MDNRCQKIVKEKGVGWLFNKKDVDYATLDVFSNIGVRNEEVQPIHCYVQDDSGTYIRIPNSSYLNELGGTFSGGMFLTLPENGNNGAIHTIFSKYGDYSFYEQDGNLHFNVSDQHTVSTSGKDFCDGNTYAVFFYRDARYTNITIGIKIYKWGSFSEVVADSDFLSTEPLHVGTYFVPADVSGTPNGVPTEGMVSGTKIHGLFFAKGQNVAEQRHMDAYWYEGYIPDNTVIYQLDEAAGEIIFDSSGLLQHGYISDGGADSWSTVQRGFSWQNRYGYSTGTYVKSKGVSDVLIGGVSRPVDDDALIPFQNSRLKEDVLLQKLEYEGRVRMNAKITDMLCYLGNGTTYGEIISGCSYEPEVSELGFFAILDTNQDNEGYLYTIGDRFSVSFNPSENTITVTVGGVSQDYALSEGFHKLLINIDLFTCYVYDGETELGNFSIGNTYTLLENNILFADSSGSNALLGSNVALLGARPSMLSDNERTALVEENKIPDLGAGSVAYFPCSVSNVVFDISGNGSHALLQEYNVDVWNGLQSVLAYMLNGFTVVGTDRNDPNKILIPLDVKQRQIPYTFYENQFTDYFKLDRGVPMFDFYLDMNPSKVESGFWSFFWNKDNSDVWSGLDTQYLLDDPNKFHIEELTQSYMEYALTSDYYRYAYSWTNPSKKKDDIELLDLVLLNFGNDVIYEPFNLL